MTRTIRSRRAESAAQPLYARMLRLRHLAPSGLLCFVFLEGAVVLGILLALAELVSWWGVLVLPVTVALMVKFNDLVAGAFVQAQPAARSANARASVLRPAAMPAAEPMPALPPVIPAGRRTAVDAAPGAWHAPAADRYGSGYSNAGFRLTPRFTGAPRNPTGQEGEPGLRFPGASSDSASREGEPGFRQAAGLEGEPGFQQAAGFAGASVNSVGLEGEPGFQQVADFAGASIDSPGLEGGTGFPPATRFAGASGGWAGAEGDPGPGPSTGFGGAGAEPVGESGFGPSTGFAGAGAESGFRPANRFAGAAAESAGEPGFRSATRFAGAADPEGTPGTLFGGGPGAPGGQPRRERNKSWPGRW